MPNGDNGQCRTTPDAEIVKKNEILTPLAVVDCCRLRANYIPLFRDRSKTAPVSSCTARTPTFDLRIWTNAYFVFDIFLCFFSAQIERRISFAYQRVCIYSASRLVRKVAVWHGLLSHTRIRAYRTF